MSEESKEKEERAKRFYEDNEDAFDMDGPILEGSPYDEDVEEEEEEDE